MRRSILPVIAIGLATSTHLAGQAVPPVPPTLPPAAQVAPWPASPPMPLVPQVPRTPPTPPAPPVPPAPYTARLVQAPGLLFSPQSSHSYLGVHLIEVSDERARELGMSEPYGVEIMSVAAGSPADDAGIRKGDVIVRFRGQRVEGQEQLVRLVRETPVGRRVELGMFRDGSEISLHVEVGERKVAAPNVFFDCGDEPCEIHIPKIRLRQFDFDIPKPRMVVQSRVLGVEIEPLEGQLAEHFGVTEGLLVRSVESNSPAARAGLKAGDAIVEVAGRTVRDSGEIREAIRSADPQKPIALLVVRNRSRISLEVEPQARDGNSFNRPGRRVGRSESF